jgi:hypothetical protein
MTKSKILVAGMLMLGSSVAFADTITQTSSGVAPLNTNIDITLTGSIESSVVLVVDSARMVQTGVNTGEVDFGSFSTNSFGTVNADRPARDDDDNGLWLAVDVNATVSYSGVTGADVSLDRVADPGVGDIPVGNLYAAANQAAVTDQAAAGLAAIDGPSASSPFDVCGGACTNGQSIDHQLAVFIPDTQAAGIFSTVVSYSATTN